MTPIFIGPKFVFKSIQVSLMRGKSQFNLLFVTTVKDSLMYMSTPPKSVALLDCIKA